MINARKQKLKVFRTPIGFHDAYVAAPSQKAALEAWGADSNLFAQGIADVVTDPELMEAALARPGEVVRVARGSAGEHLKAVGKGSRVSTPSPRPSPRSGRGRVKPSRAALDAAEEALAGVEKRHRTELRDLERERQALDRKLREAERRQESERAEAEATRDRAQRSYDRALRAWKKG